MLSFLKVRSPLVMWETNSGAIADNSELQVFTRLLGSTVNIERVEHILSGDRRCAYRVSVYDQAIDS
ncbi:MAG: hypothetical protein V7K48_28990 [Nostoc sp.]|uniref:hypothetical protein n=1 Tax=Nostoc sp. TaxID=1180 RepID=UPI002FFAA53C